MNKSTHKLAIGGEKEPFICLRNVSKTYQGEGGDFRALKGVDLDVYRGEFLGILGRSGAGKSTLLNMISGVDHLTSGSIRAGDVNLHDLNEAQFAKWRGRMMGVIYQSFQLLPTLPLVDNVTLPMDFCGTYHPMRSVERALDLLRRVGIEEHAYKLPSQISGGQQQRLAIARALVNDPPILLADEPTGRLDSVTAASVLQVFLDLARQGKTILMVTHDFSLSQVFQRTVTLADGEIVTILPN